MGTKRLNRREVIARLLVAGVAAPIAARFYDLCQSSGIEPSFCFDREGVFDTALILQKMQRLGEAPFRLLGNSTAFAAGAQADDTAVVVIKVMNLIHTPLCFKFADYTGPTSNNPSYAIRWPQKFKSKQTHDYLIANGLDKRARVSRFAALGLNDWWANILNTGRDETAAYPGFIADGDIAPFPEEEFVALQACLHLNQNNTALNHSFENLTLPAGMGAKGGDLCYHLQANQIVNSPLGITCFSMGQLVETTDGQGFIPNRVVGSDLKQVVASGRTVSDFVTILKQTLGGGFVDDALVERFDSLLGARQSLREALRGARPNLKEKMSHLSAAARVEKAVHAMDQSPYAANIQAYEPLVARTASFEFLSQVLFVKRALELPGKPMRNFNLLLNLYDVDTAPLDTVESINGGRPLSNVEGMRQLGMGLNILAQAIKQHRNLYVVVISEGGRGANGGDNKVSHAMLMGPGGANGLKDYLYADKGAIANPKDPFCVEPNEGGAVADGSPGLTTAGAGLRYHSDNVLRNANGFQVTKHATLAEFLCGVVRYIEQRRGLSTTTTGLGGYFQIKG